MELKDLGERKAIEEIRNIYRYSWPDDDCYYFESGGKYMLIKTDALYSKTHFPKEARPEKIGYFFAAANLSDIAAMGGIPRYFMSSMLLPRNTGLSYLKGLEKGIGKCLEKYGAMMVGGDLKEGDTALVGVAVGEVERDRILRRQGAEVGDLLCVTGTLGKNAAAYHMWKRHGGRRWAETLLEIEPRINAGRALSRNGATSAIDLSDGVYAAIAQLAKINGCGFEIDYSAIPFDRNAVMAHRDLGISLEELALNFGGEYELMFTIDERDYLSTERAVRKTGIGISAIGRATRKGNTLVKDGRRTRIVKKGYEHFIRGR